MKAKIGNIEVSGTPAEISAFICQQVNEKMTKKRRPISDHPCDDTGIGCAICAGEIDIESGPTDDTY